MLRIPCLKFLKVKVRNQLEENISLKAYSAKIFNFLMPSSVETIKVCNISTTKVILSKGAMFKLQNSN